MCWRTEAIYINGLINCYLFVIFAVREEDVELLNILQQLEEDNNSEKIDLDSSLAPLSQNQKECKFLGKFTQRIPHLHFKTTPI